MKKKLREYVSSICMAIFLVISLTACGGNSASKNMALYEETADTASYDAGGGIYANELAQTVEYEEAAEESETPEVSEAQASERKLIKNVTMNVETEQYDALMPVIEQQVAALGGYVEELSSYSRNNEYASEYQGTRYLRYASMTVRIPRQNLDSFLEQVGEQSNVVSRSESVTDVTLQYVDLESHKKALLTEQDRLLQLLEQAETVEDSIAIEGRLSEVRYQLESMEAQLRTYDNKIDYSTVYLNIDEVERYSPAENASMGERIRNGFLESIEGVGRGFQNVAIWFIINIPYLFVWAVLIVIVILIVRTVVKRSAKRQSVRTAKQQNPYMKSPEWRNQTETQEREETESQNEGQDGNREA